MNFNFTYQLIGQQQAVYDNFYHSLSTVTIEQHAAWTAAIDPHKKLCFFTASENERIICTAIIEENISRLIKTASISFGPLFHDVNTGARCIEEIYSYYKNNGFASLVIQPGWLSADHAKALEDGVKARLPVKYRDDKDNWTSIIVDLAVPEEQLLKNMSKGHKSDIRKAIRSGLTVVEDFSDDEFNQFTGVFKKMHAERKLPEPPQGSAAFLQSVRNNFRQLSSGKFLLIANPEKKIIGGIAILYQNKTVRYFKGAADPEVRNLPVLHVAIWEAMRDSASKGFRFFDLWGYNHYATESDQVFFVNRFKKGFGGEFIYYPKKMYLMLKPLQYKAFKALKRFYQRIFNT